MVDTSSFVALRDEAIYVMGIVVSLPRLVTGSTMENMSVHHGSSILKMNG